MGREVFLVLTFHTKVFANLVYQKRKTLDRTEGNVFNEQKRFNHYLFHPFLSNNRTQYSTCEWSVSVQGNGQHLEDSQRFFFRSFFVAHYYGWTDVSLLIQESIVHCIAFSSECEQIKYFSFHVSSIHGLIMYHHHQCSTLCWCIFFHFQFLFFLDLRHRVWWKHRFVLPKHEANLQLHLLARKAFVTKVIHSFILWMVAGI